jgi:hypothetical protein
MPEAPPGAQGGEERRVSEYQYDEFVAVDRPVTGRRCRETLTTPASARSPAGSQGSRPCRGACARHDSGPSPALRTGHRAGNAR